MLVGNFTKKFVAVLLVLALLVAMSSAAFAYETVQRLQCYYLCGSYNGEVNNTIPPYFTQNTNKHSNHQGYNWSATNWDSNWDTNISVNLDSINWYSDLVKYFFR